ncbi:hypothetical protein JX265_001531 [Neoarthrinium moseri]|uniref:SUR7 protein n=1 Tax=Neoarthrinium moseri TaxID=1658444 RepID=A0A9P9WVB3_9PEZI|nr:uncharacterized protein JN550_003926 [Neoarthrinium moseri]KAI1844546.1 hypothetical protein JX266_009219 [Neoarthrinium moseri]KAI1872207.1 hypothetical protein JN550_003926 [Neoarthrinium moseri]KAI1879910.1 hypothetical protein JX265_001531 [Neoarthrinium moseri]
MGNVGRFVCVALPFILTAASIICMLIVGLVGVTSNPSLYIFRVNTTGLSIDSSDLGSLTKLVTRDFDLGDVSSLASRTDAIRATGTSDVASAISSAASGITITAADLALKDLYDVNLWGFCSTDQDGNRACTKAKFDWASTELNESTYTSIASTTGQNVTLPDSITTSLKAFKTITKWTEVVYVIAMVALGVELFGGLFTYCSRAISCITYLISGVATVAVIAAAAMITAMASVVVGAVEASAKAYGVTASMNTSYLAAVWLGAAFAVGASLFWLFSACCCKREKHARRSRDDEKPFIPNGSYAPIHDNRHSAQSYGYNQQAYAAPRSNARTDLAYEPYSHSRV